MNYHRHYLLSATVMESQVELCSPQNLFGAYQKKQCCSISPPKKVKQLHTVSDLNLWIMPNELKGHWFSNLN